MRKGAPPPEEPRTEFHFQRLVRWSRDPRSGSIGLVFGNSVRAARYLAGIPAPESIFMPLDPIAQSCRAEGGGIHIQALLHQASDLLACNDDVVNEQPEQTTALIAKLGWKTNDGPCYSQHSPNRFDQAAVRKNFGANRIKDFAPAIVSGLFDGC
jgi:hypothetical protein